MERECNSCFKIYDTDSFGVGPKYCSSRCRHTVNGRRWETGEIGRPGRFPRPTPIMKNVIIRKLTADGWHVTEYLPKDHPYRLLVRRAHFQARICIGGGYNNEKWAQVSAFIHPDARMIAFASTCRKARQTHHIPDEHGKTKEKIYFYPCLKTTCRKCLSASWLKRIINVIDHDQIIRDELDKRAATP